MYRLKWSQHLDNKRDRQTVLANSKLWNNCAKTIAIDELYDISKKFRHNKVLEWVNTGANGDDECVTMMNRVNLSFFADFDFDGFPSEGKSLLMQIRMKQKRNWNFSTMDFPWWIKTKMECPLKIPASNWNEHFLLDFYRHAWLDRVTNREIFIRSQISLHSRKIQMMKLNWWC